MTNELKTIIHFPLAQLMHDFPCEITVITKYVNGSTSEFHLRHRWLIDSINETITENYCPIRYIKVEGD